MIALAISLVTPLLLGQAASASQAEAVRYNACLDAIDKDPEEGYEAALKWLHEGGRPGARQCTALALIALGDAKRDKTLEAQGAARLEELANAKDGGDLDQRAVYLLQAGNAWLLADSPDAAVVTLTNALKLKPKDADAHKDRARAFMVLQKWDEAGTDLDAAVDLSPGDSEAHAMRADVLIEQGRLDDAVKDVKAARKIAPRDASILVVRGRLVEARKVKGLPDDPEL